MPLLSSLAADGPTSYFTEETDVSPRELPYPLVTTSVSTAFSFVTSHELTVLLKKARPGDEILSPLANPWNWQLLLSVPLLYSLRSEDSLLGVFTRAPDSPVLKTFLP